MLESDYINSNLQIRSIYGYENFDKSDLPEKLIFLLGQPYITFQALFIEKRVDFGDGLGKISLLDTFTGIFFLIGIAISLKNYKKYEFSIIILGILIAMAASLFIHPTWAIHRRILFGFPFIILAASIGILGVYRISQRYKRLKHFTLAFLLVTLVFIPSYNVNYYFNEFPNSNEAKWVFVYDFTKVIDYVKTLDRDTKVYFYSDRWSWNYETRRFLLPSMKGEDRSRNFGEFSIEKRDEKVAYLFMPEYSYLLEDVKKRYPGGDSKEFKEDEKIIFSSYYLGLKM